ncbi:hypothetical protein CDO27_18840 (plasmid) [Sinorhizobium meliloti]|nr:hypothetical protein CDO27_18840 [Sinorhizobium meliloti]CCM70324.1 hypothetical protein BN406_04042 [Sinorhizobium meliloti Rm41]
MAKGKDAKLAWASRQHDQRRWRRKIRLVVGTRHPDERFASDDPAALGLTILLGDHRVERSALIGGENAAHGDVVAVQDTAGRDEELLPVLGQIQSPAGALERSPRNDLL